MKRIIIQDTTPIPPFHEPARELRILNKPLWLLQRDLVARHCKGAQEVHSLDEIPPEVDEEVLVHKDNLFFNARLIDTFLAEARSQGQACQIAFEKDDRTITTHARALQTGIRLEKGVRLGAATAEELYVADMYYYPPGKRQEPKLLVINTEPREMGYYSVPRYMAKQGDLVYQIPLRAFLSIESWVHIFLANTVMGVFAYASQAEYEMDRCSLRRFSRWKAEEWRLFFGKKLRLVFTALWERLNPFEEPWRNHFLASKAMVKVGKNCSIDPTAIIHGPTIIGDSVYIGPGTVITNSVIGNNVNIMQGCQVMLSVVSDRSFMAFKSALFMSSIMENGMIAQNTCVQLGVVGRNSFLGANSVFTDFNLSDKPEKQTIRTFHNGKLQSTGLPVLGSVVGHNCKIGSGFVVYPGRAIGSNVTITFNDHEGLIRTDVAGRSPDDVDEQTGEPRRVFYRWPHIYEPESDMGGLTPDESNDPSGRTHDQLSDHGYHHGYAHPADNNHVPNDRREVADQTRPDGVSRPVNSPNCQPSTEVLY